MMFGEEEFKGILTERRIIKTPNIAILKEKPDRIEKNPQKVYVSFWEIDYLPRKCPAGSGTFSRLSRCRQVLEWV